VRVVVDPETCMGHGQCYARAAQVYLPGDEGVCGVIEPEVDGEWWRRNDLASNGCT
jgi:ferredoxin